jgi:hypothetical protein
METLPPSQGEPQWSPEASREFLIAEYGHVSGALLSNEEAGERRLNIFVGLIAAATAAIGLAFDQLDGGLHALGLAVGGACVALLLFGLATLRRLMERNLATDEYVEGLRRMRVYVADRDRELVHVMGFAPSRKPREARRTEVWKLGKAGLLEINALTDCLLVAVGLSASLAATGLEWWMWLPVALAGAVYGWWLQMKWAIRVYDRETSKRVSTRAKVIDAWKEGES